MANNVDLAELFAEQLDGGNRPVGRGVIIRYGGWTRGVFIVRYKKTFHENKDGRWN